MYKLTADNEKIATELDEEIRLFFPDGKGSPESIFQTCSQKDNLAVHIDIDGRTFDFIAPLPIGSELEYKRRYVRFNKLCMYKALSRVTSRRLPWGSLTGVRPTKLAYELIESGMEEQQAVQELTDTYLVSKEKADLLFTILNAQRGIYERSEKKINLYVHIPFCVSKCSYCSFMTDVLTPTYKWVDPYVDALVYEIEQTRKTLSRNGYDIYSVYVGGGTPTALNEEQLARVLKSAYCEGAEFTCEAGRPDTVNSQKLRIMADSGVNRICINPQSLNDETLEKIGRRHTAADFYSVFAEARKYPFSINTDLIAGLEGEDGKMFRNTLNGILTLRPENVTVHTLSLKNGSALKLSEYTGNEAVGEMVDVSRQVLLQNGYVPYYMYRQKRMLGNLENVGYTLSGKQCVNNVTTMEECLGVAACGAGAISKRIYIRENRIERLANLRDVRLYLNQFDERLQKKLDFFL